MAALLLRENLMNFCAFFDSYQSMQINIHPFGKASRHLYAVLLLLTPLLAPWPALASSPFDGLWEINLEETDKVSVEFKEGGGLKGAGINTSVSVMGLPLPSRYRQSPMSELAAKDPEVLLCTQMNIAVTDKRIQLKYDSDDSETLRKGEYRGRFSKWSKKRIEQRYKTPERSVRKTWTLRDDGRLLVAVKINPRGDQARTYNRVFDRIAPSD